MAAEETEEPKNIWQHQATDDATEIQAMTLDEMRSGADELKTTVGWRNLREYFATAVVVWCFASHLYATHIPLLRAGDALSVAAALFVAWQLHRRGSATLIPAHLPARAYMMAYRDELRRQHDALRKVPLWYEAPFLPGLVLIMAGQVQRTGRWGATIALAIVMLLVFAGVWYMNVLASRRLAARIDAVEALLADAG